MCLLPGSLHVLRPWIVKAPANLVGIELIVRRIDSAVVVFVDAFGWEVVYDGPAAETNGRAVVLDAGAVAVTLLEPADAGEDLLADRSPRLTQIVVGGSDAGEAVDRLTALGLPTRGAGPGRRFVPPEAVEGLLGFETALMVNQIDDSPDEG